MVFHVLTLFPELIRDTFGTSITGRALKNGQIVLNAVNIRDYADNKHHKVDDYPYGGGAGLLMQAEPVYRAYEAVKNQSFESGEALSSPRVIYVTPQGSVFDQEMAREFSREKELVFLCGHYEGIDERVLEEVVTDYVSVGDYVLTGGELAALVMMDAISRLVPGVLNNETSAEFESFHKSLLEYPQYSRPEVWHEKQVPSELLSGNHRQVNAWRLERAKERTKIRRPDLYREYERQTACEKQLSEKKLLHMDMLEALRSDRGKIKVFNREGILLLDTFRGICQITAENEEAGAAMLEALIYDRMLQMAVMHQEFLVERAAKELKLFKIRRCFQYVYTQKSPLPPCRGSKVCLLEDSFKEQIFRYLERGGCHFSFENALKEGRMYGAFEGETLTGILKVNKAGAMDFLSVNDTERSLEIGKALETAWINQQIVKERTPFAWIGKKQEELFSLQESLGLYRAKGELWILEER